MASKPESFVERLPWYRRWFSRSSSQSGVARATAGNPTTSKPSTASRPAAPVTYHCKVCGFAAKSRGLVYDHIKATHRDVIDRNGNIAEDTEVQPPTVS